MKRLTPFMCCLLPPIVATRKFGNRAKPKPGRSEFEELTELKIIPVLNGLLTMLLRLEKWIVRFVNLPFGSSLFAVAINPSEDSHA